MFIRIPDDAPSCYGVVTKTVSGATFRHKEPRQGRFYLPPKWVGGKVILYHTGTKEYTEERRVLAQGNAGVIYVPKDWIGVAVITFLVAPPPPEMQQNKQPRKQKHMENPK